jgi:hypothetical protein
MSRWSSLFWGFIACALWQFVWEAQRKYDFLLQAGRLSDFLGRWLSTLGKWLVKKRGPLLLNVFSHDSSGTGYFAVC